MNFFNPESNNLEGRPFIKEPEQEENPVIEVESHTNENGDIEHNVTHADGTQKTITEPKER